jgi:molybdenum cofactor biosynthesis enzyme
MTGEIDQTSFIIDDVTVSCSKSSTGTEIEAAYASSSSNVAIQTMVKKEAPKMYE